MNLPASIKSPDNLLPAAGALLCLATMGWTVVWGIQMQMAHTIAGAPPLNMTTYWVLLGVLTLKLVAMLFLENALSKPSASQVCYKRRPLLESEVQRLALRQLMRIEARL
jgi:hypothetical protein